MSMIENREQQIKSASEIIAYGCSDELKAALIQDFPELAESEDERIRKSIILLLQRGGYMSPEDKDKAYAWLEKQKESLHISETCKENADSFTDEDERIRKLLVWQVHRNIEDETNDLAQSVYDGIKGHDPDLEESIEDWKKCLAYLEKQKEQKPAEWSEKDEKIWKDIFDLCNRFGYDDACRLLKSISRRSWKPSEEQMFALDSAILMFHNLKRGGDKKELESLYNDLKKL